MATEATVSDPLPTSYGNGAFSLGGYAFADLPSQGFDFNEIPVGPQSSMQASDGYSGIIGGNGMAYAQTSYEQRSSVYHPMKAESSANNNQGFVHVFVDVDSAKCNIDDLSPPLYHSTQIVPGYQSSLENPGDGDNNLNTFAEPMQPDLFGDPAFYSHFQSQSQ